MKYICTMDSEICECPHRSDNDTCCNQDTKCAFRQAAGQVKDIRTRQGYVREPRWYEKYINKKK